jgi:hypothetical protein
MYRNATDRSKQKLRAFNSNLTGPTPDEGFNSLATALRACRLVSCCSLFGRKQGHRAPKTGTRSLYQTKTRLRLISRRNSAMTFKPA